MSFSFTAVDEHFMCVRNIQLKIFISVHFRLKGFIPILNCYSFIIGFQRGFFVILNQHQPDSHKRTGLTKALSTSLYHCARIIMASLVHCPPQDFPLDLPLNLPLGIFGRKGMGLRKLKIKQSIWKWNEIRENITAKTPFSITCLPLKIRHGKAVLSSKLPKPITFSYRSTMCINNRREQILWWINYYGFIEPF